jgi:hypothetical protein
MLLESDDNIAGRLGWRTAWSTRARVVVLVCVAGRGETARGCSAGC